ncbi:hypothetical protein NW768_004814 [Fusarium equiseti]|uniref:Uncharacterized protein n=1 Tax=Fusarium equiseti TaxID=61235 RepID=A0ABQ8RHA7_FUSEQ|nr:hypothetical protein NW768_004814 [Fusarium equiseti]
MATLGTYRKYYDDTQKGGPTNPAEADSAKLLRMRALEKTAANNWNRRIRCEDVNSQNIPNYDLRFDLVLV